MSANHNKLIFIDDLRSIGQLLCQASHAAEQYAKLLNSDEVADPQTLHQLANRIYQVNFQRRTEMSNLIKNYGIEQVLDGKRVKGNPDAYCESKHAIFNWALTEEKLLSTEPHMPSVMGGNEEGIKAYAEASQRFQYAYKNMLSVVANWLGVKELTYCSDCLWDKLSEEKADKEEPKMAVFPEPSREVKIYDWSVR